MFVPGLVEATWNVMAHVQKPDFVFQRNGRVRLNQWGRQISRLLAAAVCTSAVVMLDTPCSEVVWRVLATHSIHQFPLHFPPVCQSVPSHFNWISNTVQHFTFQVHSVLILQPAVTTLVVQCTGYDGDTCYFLLTSSIALLDLYHKYWRCR